MKSDLNLKLTGHIHASYVDTGETVLDIHNDIHPRNMARIIARALSNEPNSSIFRMAFGNGGSITDAGGNVILNPPNTGNSSGWEDRLYNEVYSEVVDENSALLGTDIGSSDPTGSRPGGGASELDDPAGTGVSSLENGLTSKVIITAFINNNEPAGQLPTQSSGPFEENKQTFMFDEMGLYSGGKQARASNGYTSIDVGNRESNSLTPLSPNTVYTFEIIVDRLIDGTGGRTLAASIETPAAGSGPLGEITYGDLCEALNTNSWATSTSNDLSEDLYFYITDLSPNVSGVIDAPYPSIYGANSFGYFIAQRKTTGPSSSVSFVCNSGSATDLINLLAGGECQDNVNVNSARGQSAGLSNDPLTPANERERLLTHITFSPVLKSADRALRIVYTITVAVECGPSALVTMV